MKQLTQKEEEIMDRMWEHGPMQVRELQAQLKVMGYYNGDVTGIYDTATKKSVIAFQKKNGLTAYGIAGAETQKLLFSAGAAATVAESEPSAGSLLTTSESPSPIDEASGRNSSHNIQSFNNPPYFHSYDTQFKHTTQVSAAYLDYMFESGKWSGRAGLRYEHTYMGVHFPDGKSSDHSHHLNDWVPQASLKYQIDELKLNYTTNITRPGIEYLNPAIVTNPSSVQSGNPNLVSCHSQRLTLLYMYVGNRLTLQLAPSFNFSNKAIGIINTVEDDIRHTTYANVLRLRRWQLEGYIQWKPFDTTTFVANYNFWHNKSHNPGIGLSMDGWAGFYYASISQQLPWKLRLSASSYGSVGHDPNNVYGYSRSWINYGGSLQRSFLKDDRLTVRLQTTFPFQKHRHDRSVVTQGDYTGWSDETMMGRRFTLSVSFKFGKLKASVKKTDTTIENDDVVGGISKGKN